jgi:hypothetical protein
VCVNTSPEHSLPGLLAGDKLPMPVLLLLLGRSWFSAVDDCLGLLGSSRIVKRPFLKCIAAASPISALPSDTALVSWPGAVQDGVVEAELPCMLPAALAAPGDIHQNASCGSAAL